MSENTEKKERVKAFTKASEIKKTVKEAGKRTSKDFLSAFDNEVEKMLQKCISEHNGGKKTLDAALVRYMFGGR